MRSLRTFVTLAALISVLAPASISARTARYGAVFPARHRTVLLINYPEPPSNSAAYPADAFPKISAEKSGVLPVKVGGTLRLNIELGNVRIFTDERAQISYRAAVEADPRDPGAQEFLRQFKITSRATAGGVEIIARVPWQGLRARFHSEIELHIPRAYNLEVTTGGGNLEVQDIDGRVTLLSAGGNISVGRVGGAGTSGSAERNSTAAKRPAPKSATTFAARVETQGGQISVGSVAGSLRAVTAGGHIIAGNIAGDAILQTGGGQIFAGRIAGSATLDSGGGNVQIESAAAGVTSDAAGGGLVVRRAEAPLQVAATGGGLTAWLNVPAGKSSGHVDAHQSAQASQLSSTGGDIVLYLPRNLAATIDARIEQGDGHRIFADPSLPVQISERDSQEKSRALHYAIRLNGGGDLLHLKAVAGNIVLRASDPDARSSSDVRAGAGYAQSGASPASVQSMNSAQASEFADADGFFAEMRRRILESWWGAVPVDAEEIQKHLERSVAPAYPDVARQAGIEGDVILRIFVSSSGRVTDIKVLDGPPILARAAIQAVQQWEYQAPRMDGRPTAVVTDLVVSFRMH
jgi:TonB family protein